MAGPFKLPHILNVARRHPFYSPIVPYPPSCDDIASMQLETCSSKDAAALLSEFNILEKEDLHEIITRLIADEHTKNTFLHSSYISMSGGGGGSSFVTSFSTDIQENRAQRRACGILIQRLGVLTQADRVLSMHTSGNMYRALDLTIDIVENSGATILPVGHAAGFSSVKRVYENFRPNVISGDSSQILRFASHVESIGAQDTFRFSKIMYTSESMTRVQRAYLESIFGQEGMKLEFISLLASAETGPSFVSSSTLTTQFEDSNDFIYDSRTMIIEVLPMDFQITSKTRNYPASLGYEGVGLLVMTSLQRLRNPLVRYLTGDIGSLHAFPKAINSKVGGDTDHLRILRLYGRDPRRSFKWQGEYFEFSRLEKLMASPCWGVLKWQVIMETALKIPNSFSLEVRIMRAVKRHLDKDLISDEDLTTQVREFFWVDDLNSLLFELKFVSSEDFVRSATGNKVIMFVDRR